jgi:hypothetical protein
MRSGLFRRLGAIIGAIGAATFGRQSSLPFKPAEENPELPKSSRVGGGHPRSKPHSDSTFRIRARKRWLKKRRRDSRRGVYTTRGPRV